MSEMEIQPRKFLISAVSVAIVAVFIAGCGFYFNKCDTFGETYPSTDAKKRLALNTLVIAIYNLQPAGRGGILSTSEEKAFRENVSNINRENDLYHDLGLQNGASEEEVEKAFGEKRAALIDATSTEAEGELARAVYAHSVLSKSDSRALYDETKIEPTIFTRRLGNTLYVNMSRISPTTLSEFGKAILAAPESEDSMIIDLRGNIGGSLDFVQAFLGLFLGQNQFAYDLYAKDEYKPQRTTFQKAEELKQYEEIAVLTDSMTQSSAELLVSSFKRFRLGVVVGKATRGWGTIENTYPLETKISSGESYSLLLVNHITLRDDNQPIEGRGVEPDIDTSKTGWESQLGRHFKSAGVINAVRQSAKQEPMR